jgi:serine/threonine protein kinase/ABC-type branched-subunit amino acid transport system substrate-binding protein
MTRSERICIGAELAGKYRFIAEIGHGGMADVFLTVTKGAIGGFQKLVVLKLLRADMSDEEDFRRMFLDEARLAARLNHPNVVQTYDVGEEGGRYYLAMEYLEGQSFERIRRARSAFQRFPQRMQLQMLVHALSGLHYAHELADYDGKPLHVIHRDVTPSNILISYDGQVKLVDFGIAKVLDSAIETRAGVIKGKTGYMAPEQFTVGCAIDRRADIFSVGVVLWEMLAGRRMWRELPPSDRLQRIMNGHIQPLRELSPKVPPELEQICMRALSRLPDGRQATAAQLKEEIEDYLVQHPPRVSERELGQTISEMFCEEREQIHEVIEHQLKGTGSAPISLPDLREISPRHSITISHSGFDSASTARTADPPRLFPRRLKTPLVVVAAAVAVVALAAFALDKTPWRKPAGSMAAIRPAVPVEQTTKPVRGVSDTEILMGMSAAFSGPARELGTRMKLGIETAFAAVNESGGIAGRTLKLVALDDGYEGKRALENMHELVDKRGVFGLIGNVGTPTALVTVPYAVAQRTVFFGAFTGANLLRKDPPDRYVFNYRASYEEETAKMVHYLLDNKHVAPRSVVVFAQHDAYGDAGYEGAVKTMRKTGHGDVELLRANYERNTVDVDAAVNQILEYHRATIVSHAPGGHEIVRAKHPVKAIIMVCTYKAAVRFIQKIHDAGLETFFLNVSFVGSNALADELKELGAQYGNGVIITQVVPHFDSGATGIIRYRETLQKFHPDQHPDFLSLEGYIVGELFAEGLRRAGRALDTEKLIDALESIRELDIGTGTVMSFGMSAHQSSHKVWGTVLDEQLNFQSLDMD